MRIRRLNHSVYQIEYHIVWGTKYRRKILKDYVKTEFIKSIEKVQRKYPDLYIPKLNTADDHIHLIMEIPPKYSVSEMVQKIKIRSSIELRKKFKFINKIYEDGNIWGVGYFVSTIGLNEEQIRKYIEKQNNYDRGFDAADEFS